MRRGYEFWSKIMGERERNSLYISIWARAWRGSPQSHWYSSAQAPYMRPTAYPKPNDMLHHSHAYPVRDWRRPKKKKKAREREGGLNPSSFEGKRRTYYPWNQERRHDKAPFAISFCHTCYIYAYVYVYVYINAPRFVSYRLTLTDIMSLTMVYVNMLYIALRPINVLVRRTRDQLTNGHMSLLT